MHPDTQKATGYTTARPANPHQRYQPLLPLVVMIAAKPLLDFARYTSLQCFFFLFLAYRVLRNVLQVMEALPRPFQGTYGLAFPHLLNAL